MKNLQAIAFVLSVAGVGSAYGQVSTGALVGTVTDKTGAVVANAAVTVTNQGTGVHSDITSNGSGEFRIPTLATGLYTVTASGAGFKAITLKDFLIESNKNSTVNLTLPVTSDATVDVVTEAQVALDTTTTQLQQTFSTKETQDLPSANFGGNGAGGLGVLNLALLSPGVSSGGGIGAGTGPSVGGQRTRNNNYNIEGIDNNNQSVTGPSVTVPNDAVGEFTLLTNMFSPEFGHSTGGQFNVLVLSGTNKFHGRAYENFQNRNLNAINQIIKNGSTPGLNPRYDFNRFGGQLGGPIFRDRLFFFSNFEKQQQGQTISNTRCTPTAAGYALLATQSNVSVNNLAQLQKYVPAATVTTGSCPTSIQYSGTNGAVAIPTGGYAANAPAFINGYLSTNSVDYTLSQHDSVRGRYIYNKFAQQDTTAYLPSFFQPSPSLYHLGSLSEYHTFTANLVNEFRLGYSRYVNTTPSGNFTFTGLDSFPNLQFNDLNNLQVGPNPNSPQDGIQNMYQAVNTVSYTKGKHTMKFGFDGRKYISPSHFTQRVRGDYEYTKLDLYLRDITPDYLGERSTGNFKFYGDQTAFYGFANDIYRATQKLSLNVGLRYEFTSVPAGVKVQSLNQLASVPGLLNFGSPQPQMKNFAPRVGFVYAPDEKTSIRVGFGLGYDVLFNNLGTLSKPPQYSGTQDVVLSSGTPNFLANGGLLPGPGTLLTYPTIAAQRAATSAFVPNQTLPYSETWTAQLQHVFGANYTAQIQYVGTRGIHLPAQIQLNRQAVINSQNALPTYNAVPNDQTLQTSNRTLGSLSQASAKGQILASYVPAYAAAGFGPTGPNDATVYQNITSYQPYGQSIYHGLSGQLTRRFVNGLQMNLAYTFSKLLDNSTAEVFSTTLTPRRPQDFQNIKADRSVSAIDHRNRFTVEAIYDWHPFKNSNYLLKNLLGNWEIAPVYTFQSPEYYTPQSGVDSNLNGDAAPDRTIINPLGKRGTGTGVVSVVNTNIACPANALGRGANYNPGTTTLATSCRANIVGYVPGAVAGGVFTPNNNAYYVQAGLGALSTAARNTEALPGEYNLDLSVLKRLTYEHYNLEIGAQASNVLNHAQFIGGNISTIGNPSASSYGSFSTVSSGTFNKPKALFSSNPRLMQLSAKFTF